MSRFIALDWHEGAAVVIMSNMFRLLAMASGFLLSPERR